MEEKNTQEESIAVQKNQKNTEYGIIGDRADDPSDIVGRVSVTGHGGINGQISIDAFPNTFFQANKDEDSEPLDKIEVEDNVFNAEDFMAPMRMTAEEIAKSQNEIGEIRGLVGNLVDEVDKLIDNTIKTNYFEIVKTQKAIAEVRTAVVGCINIIKLKKEMEEMTTDSDNKHTDSELADKIAKANEEELIGTLSHDDLIKDCENLIVKIDCFSTAGAEFINSSREQMKFTSTATDGIIEMLNHTIELEKDIMSIEEVDRINSFVDIYRNRGNKSIFSMFNNDKEIERSTQKFAKMHKKKNKLVKRYSKTVLGYILGKNNVPLFYASLEHIIGDDVIPNNNERKVIMDRYVYVICRLIHLEQAITEQLKSKLAILSIFDIYFNVYDYDNLDEIKELLTDVFIKIDNAANNGL